MTNQFPCLLSPGNIGRVEIRNRIVTAPVWTGFAGRDGSVTPRLVTYYTEKAKGGAGLVIIEYTYIDDIASKSVMDQLSASDEDYVPGLALLAQAIHDWGAKCAVQLCHAGPMRILRTPLFYGPSDGMYDVSPIAGPMPPLKVTGLNREQMSGIIRAFASAAARVERAGFDMVEVHAAHGYLLTHFLSPHHNKRTDEYGGSLENRMRFPLEVIRAVRQKVGSGFGVTVRISGTDYEPELPITIDDSVVFARNLEEVGVDAIHVSGGSDVRADKLNTPTYQKLGFNVYLAEAVKKRSGVRIPIIASGAITTPAFAEEILRQGKADFVSLGRPSIADPHWGTKLKQGRPEDVVPCIRCNIGCMTLRRGASCAVNPLLGYEGIRMVAPLEERRNVAIIGGGPAGMEAARLATVRGHQVILYERRELGGALIEASWDPELKPDIRLLLEYYLTQMKKLGVKVINDEATVETIVNGAYDAAIVATGAVAQRLDVPGIEKPHVFDFLEITGGKEKDLGRNVIIVGGGMIAAEIALSQALKGKKVILTTRRGHVRGKDEIADDAPAPSRLALSERLSTNDVDIQLGLSLEEVLDDGIISVDQKGNAHRLAGDSVVICAGFQPNNVLADALKHRMKVVYAIGDCVKPRFIYNAIHEGWIAANQL